MSNGAIYEFRLRQ